MSSRDGVVMYELEKERRAEILAEYGPQSYRKYRRELPGFRPAWTPAAIKTTIILTGPAAVAIVSNLFTYSPPRSSSSDERMRRLLF